jgi:hypothetical protein
MKFYAANKDIPIRLPIQNDPIDINDAIIIKITTMPQQQYQECIEACRACATLCLQCASACLLEEDVKGMTRCIQLDLECASLCNAAAQVMSLNGELSGQLCQLCENICSSCAGECEDHPEMKHCRDCAAACRQCAEVCAQMAQHA